MPFCKKIMFKMVTYIPIEEVLNIARTTICSFTPNSTVCLRSGLKNRVQPTKMLVVNH